MHFQSFRTSALRRRWLQLWLLLLLVPACLALATVSPMIAAVAVTLTFGLPLGVWLALTVHDASEFRAQVPDGIRLAAGVSLSILGFVGLFIFSAGLAFAALAAYVVTVGLVAWAPTHAGAHHWPTAAPNAEMPAAHAVEETATGVVVTPDKVREMTDAELCQAWRRSFVALQRTRGVQLRALVVQTRQLLLDEVEARHPAGLRAWLSSGARAAGGPDRFIGSSGGDGGQPEAA